MVSGLSQDIEAAYNILEHKKRQLEQERENLADTVHKELIQILQGNPDALRLYEESNDEFMEFFNNRKSGIITQRKKDINENIAKLKRSIAALHIPYNCQYL